MYTKLGRHEWQTEYAALEAYEYCDAAERFGWLPRRLTGQTAPLREDTWEATCGGELLPKEQQKTLILGSGNSTLGEEMHAAGWADVTSIDFSEVCIDIAKQRAPQLQWKTMDAANLAKEFAPASFDLVVDKGLLDSMHLVGDPGSEAIEKISRGVQSVLTPGTGRFVWLSLSAPSVWVQDHGGLGEGWGSIEARRLAETYLYIYRPPAAQRAAMGSKSRRRK